MRGVRVIAHYRPAFVQKNQSLKRSRDVPAKDVISTRFESVHERFERAIVKQNEAPSNLFEGSKLWMRPPAIV